MSAEPLTPERRRELTRRHLLDAAAAEFARSGFHGTSLDAVAAAAGFTKGAVYSNFENKADLFVAVLDDHMERQNATLTDAIEEDFEDPSARYSHVQGVANEHRMGEEWNLLWLEFLLYAARQPDIRAKLAELRRRQLAAIGEMIAGEYRRHGTEPDRPIPLLALVSLAVFDGLDTQRLIDPESVTPSTQDELIAFLSDAVGVPPEPEA
jgi:AcrR family transcriptional regulator